MDSIKINSKNVKMVAHRGLSALERENTAPAFIAAANRSYFGIETDIHLTKDKRFVVIHDETLNRVSGGKYTMNVEECEYKDIENVVLPDIDGSENRQDIRIPLLEDYVKICKKYEKICVLEVKNHFPVEEIKRLTEEICALGYEKNVIFISFDFENCVNVKKCLPQNKVQYLLGNVEITTELAKKLKDNGLDIDIAYGALTKENIELLHSEGIEINCWTCDDKAAAEKLADCGVDYITSNILE